MVAISAAYNIALGTFTNKTITQRMSGWNLLVLRPPVLVWLCIIHATGVFACGFRLEPVSGAMVDHDQMHKVWAYVVSV